MLSCAKFGNEFLKGAVRELGPVVGDYRLWDAKTSEDISFVEAKDVLGGDLGQSFAFYPLGEVFDRYC